MLVQALGSGFQIYILEHLEPRYWHPLSGTIVLCVHLCEKDTQNQDTNILSSSHDMPHRYVISPCWGVLEFPPFLFKNTVPLPFPVGVGVAKTIQKVSYTVAAVSILARIVFANVAAILLWFLVWLTLFFRPEIKYGRKGIYAMCGWTETGGAIHLQLTT